jgi:hypothetical protein
VINITEFLVGVVGFPTLVPTSASITPDEDSPPLVTALESGSRHWTNTSGKNKNKK